MSKLLGYNFSIVYKPGCANRAADALSQKKEPIECSSIGGPQWRQWDSLKREIEEDEFLKKIKNDLLVDPNVHKGFELQQDLLLYKGRLVLPRKSKFIPLLF